jgi:hypothetical protein
MKWLYKHFRKKIDFVYTKRVVVTDSKIPPIYNHLGKRLTDGYTTKVEALVDDKKVPDKEIYNKSFKAAGYNGHLEIVKWLMEKGVDKIDNVCLEQVLAEATRNGHLNIVEWLIGEHVDKIDPFYIKEAYRISLESDELEISDYIVSAL